MEPSPKRSPDDRAPVARLGAALPLTDSHLIAHLDSALSRLGRDGVDGIDLDALCLVVTAEHRADLGPGTLAGNAFAPRAEGATAALIRLARFVTTRTRASARTTMALWQRAWPQDFAREIERLRSARERDGNAPFASPARVVRDTLGGFDPDEIVDVIIDAVERKWWIDLERVAPSSPAVWTLMGMFHKALVEDAGDAGGALFGRLCRRLGHDGELLFPVVQAMFGVSAVGDTLVVRGLTPTGSRVARRFSDVPAFERRQHLDVFARLIARHRPSPGPDALEAMAEAAARGLPIALVRRALAGDVASLERLFPELATGDAARWVRRLVAAIDPTDRHEALARLILILAHAPSGSLELVAQRLDVEHLGHVALPWRDVLAGRPEDLDSRLACLMKARHERPIRALLDETGHAPILVRLHLRADPQIPTLARLVELAPRGLVAALGPPGPAGAGPLPAWARGLTPEVADRVRRLPPESHARAELIVGSLLRGESDATRLVTVALDQLADRAAAAAWGRRLAGKVALHALRALGPPALAARLDPCTLSALAGLRPPERALATRVLAHVARGEALPLRALPENAAFLAEMGARGLRLEPWLGDARPSPLAGYRARLASDLPTVLALGETFRTCLGLGQAFFASTLVVAASANLRALVIEDERGKMVARAIVGLTPAGLCVYRFYGHDKRVAEATLTPAVVALGRDIGCAVGTHDAPRALLDAPSAYTDTLETPNSWTILRGPACVFRRVSDKGLLDELTTRARYGLLSADLPRALAAMGAADLRPDLGEALAARLVALGQVGVAERVACLKDDLGV
ncbi:MAG: hypothetical protein IT385_11355 [Deltaproteobacteria bacterium]|nr:hypothetical protein [Deltaproteobacteria bacterium]